MPIRQRESAWVGEAVVRCGFAAVELSLGLLDVLAGDARPYIPQRARAIQLIDAIITQIDLVGQGLALDPAGLAAARRIPERARHGWLIDNAFARRGDELGLRLAGGLSRALGELPPGTAPVGGAAPPVEGSLPYDEWVDSRELWTRASASPYCFEDLPFRTVHQTLECWFQAMLEILDYGAGRAAARDWSGATATTCYLADLLYFLAGHIRLLDYMDLSDYHPLRVVLKSASGAQSEAAGRVISGIRRQFEPLAALLPGAPATPPSAAIARVFERPADHPAEYLYIEALGRLESAFADFLHSHYYRALRVQTRRGLGSLGKGVDGLLERALKPLFPAIDQARFEYLLACNWQLAPVQGTLIEQLVGSAATSAGPAALDAAMRRLAVDRVDALHEALVRGDVAACVAPFEIRSACLWELRGTRAYHGTGEIRGYFESVFQSMTIAAVRPLATEWIDERLVRRIELDVVAFTGHAATLPATWELELGERAEIRALVIEWDTALLARLMMTAPPP